MIALARERVADPLDAKVLDGLDAVAARASGAAARAGKAFKAAAKKLGQSELAVDVLDWGAEVLREAGNFKNGASLFKTARSVERKVGLAVDEAARMERYRRFAAVRMVDGVAMAAYVKDLARAKARDQVDALLDLVVSWVASAGRLHGKRGSVLREYVDARVGVVTRKLMDAVRKLGSASKRKDLDAVLLRRLLGVVHIAEDAVWERHLGLAAEALRGDAAPQLRQLRGG